MSLLASPTATLGPVDVEILRHRIEALTLEASRTIQRTAISPVVVENGDYCTALLDGDGGLIVGGGKIVMQFNGATFAVRAITAMHPDVAPGDVFLSNDPHNGGSLHPQDVFVIRPVHLGNELVGWVANCAHMMDLGGMVPGSFAPNATECYQEAVRVPPIRLARGGVEQRDVWAMLLNNIRMSSLVEMDLRALIAGANVGHDGLAALVEETGLERFRAAVVDLNHRTRGAIGQRISELADGTYRTTQWAEWKDEQFRIPCTLTVDGSTMHFDFTGAAPQTDHFMNSKEHVVKSMLSMYLGNFLLGDLPMNQGYLDSFTVHCPEGSILNSTPPAPIGAAHILACMDAAEASLRAVVAAASASPGSYVSRYVSSIMPNSALSLIAWAGQGHSGAFDAWLMQDNVMMGSPAAAERDGTDFYFESVSRQNLLEANDVETTEAWYPLRFSYRRRGAALAPGKQRGGAGVELAYRATLASGLQGTATGGHGRLPSIGSAGGAAGQPTYIAIRHEDGSEDQLSLVDQGFGLGPGDEFVCRAAGGAGWGDPLDRDPVAVERDVEAGRVTAEEARVTYGVVTGDAPATEGERAAIGQARLAAARRPSRPVEAAEVDLASLDASALAPGVEQRGSYAVSTRSGAVLAVAPDPWTGGCAVRVEELNGGFESRSYLDPRTGWVLATEVVPMADPTSFEAAPRRWTDAG